MGLPTPKFGDVKPMSKKEALSYAKDLMSRGPQERAKRWSRTGDISRDGEKISGGLPICPYGCGREGTLLEIVRQDDGRYTGIFNDHPCSCVFIADIEIGEPPTKRRQVIGPDGEMHIVEG